MTSRLNRRVMDYPDWYVHLASGTVKLGSSITYDSTNGPGEIQGFQINQVTGTPANFLDLQIKLTIDSVQIYSGYLYWLYMGYFGYVFHSLFAVGDIDTNGFMSTSARWTMPIAATWQIVLSSANVTGNVVYMNVQARYGK